MFLLQWEKQHNKVKMWFKFYFPISVSVKRVRELIDTQLSPMYSLYTLFIPCPFLWTRWHYLCSKQSANEEILLKKGGRVVFLFSVTVWAPPSTREKAVRKHCIPQMKKSSNEYTGPPSPMATLEQLATAVKEVPGFPFFHRHITTLEFKLSSQCKYKNDQSQGFMAIFC